MSVLRRTVFACVVVLLVGVAPDPMVAEQGTRLLPERLSAEDFWQVSTQMSEPDAGFLSDNLVSNEMSFAQVVPQLRSWTEPGGVYIGVGPEQNFTFLVAMRARLGFIVDIRRDNLLLHLLYKALFDLSPNRVAFLSRLLSKASPTIPTTARIEELMNEFTGAPSDGDDAYRQKLSDIHGVLSAQLQIPLTTAGITTIDRAYDAFRRFGPALGYSTTRIGQPFGEVNYANLMKQSGAGGEALSYLATEEKYQFIRDLQARNLVIPVVGNFAGPRAIRAIGSYLRDRNATVAAFYVSNVEDYLGKDRVPANGDWNVFCANAAVLPRTARSVFIRPFGLAVFGADGSITLSRRMQTGARSTDAVTVASGSESKLPSALTTIADDVKKCGGS